MLVAVLPRVSICAGMAAWHAVLKCVNGSNSIPHVNWLIAYGNTWCSLTAADGTPDVLINLIGKTSRFSDTQ